MHIRARSSLVVASIVLFALTACATADEPSGSVAPTSTRAAGVTGGIDSDPMSFVAADLETGELIDASSFVGHDTILWFWASWCPICQAESGAIVNAMAEPDFPADVTVLGIAGYSDPESSLEFVDERNVGGFRHVYDDDGSIWRSFGVTAQPTLVFVSADGTMTSKQGGYGKWDILGFAQDLAAS